MRKVLSIVLALLMVSMMIPSMAFAADDLSATGVPAVSLVAGQSFDLTITSASANVTVKVNTNVFDLPGTEDVAGKIGYITCAPSTITITVKTDIPTVEFTSNIRIEDEDDAISVPVKVDDRLVGDVTGDDVSDIIDANQIARTALGITPGATYNDASSDLNNDDTVDIIDANQIARAALGIYSEVSIGVGKYASGKKVDEIVVVTEEFEDPTSWDTTTEPDEPEVIKLTTPAIKTAIAQNGIIYYELDAAVADAEAYEFYVGETLMATKTEISGSFKYAYTPGMEITVVATTTKANYEDSEPSAAVSVEEHTAPAGTLADWLKANDLEGVAITVHNISAE